VGTLGLPRADPASFEFGRHDLGRRNRTNLQIAARGNAAEQAPQNDPSHLHDIEVVRSSPLRAVSELRAANTGSPSAANSNANGLNAPTHPGRQPTIPALPPPEHRRAPPVSPRRSAQFVPSHRLAASARHW